MRTAYDNHPNTQLFLDNAQGCTSVLDLFEKIKKIDDTILQGNITEGLVKVMLDSQKFFKMKNVKYAGTNQEGIDIISEHQRKGKTTVQVKFRSSETLSNDDLNSFGKVNWLKGYEHGYVIGNLRDVPADWHNDKVSLFLKEDFRDIDLQELIEFASIEKTAAPSGPMTPRGFQSMWLEQMRSNINKMTRGKILGPPGLGKTLGIASYVRMLKKNKIGYIGAPWIRLVNQNMIGVVNELEAHGYNVNYISVHSSQNVNGNNTELNQYNIVPPTTDAKEIRNFLKEAKKDKSSKNLYIVFACYGSTEKIIEAFKGYRLDYGAFDEAHNLTGHKTKARPQLVFEKNIKFARRAFVTATERTYNGKNDEVVAMNNAKLFGGILCFCSFKDAIDHKNIKDYRVVFPRLSGDQLEEWWNKLKNNAYVQDNGEPVTMDMVALKAMIYMMYSEYSITRMVAGFNRIENAKQMSKFLATPDSITKHFGFVVKSTWVSSHETQVTNNLRIGEFADSQEKYVLCAPPMLKEGVDIKGKDKNGKNQYPNAVVFCDNKRGEIGIVQLAGRGLRMGQDQNELCYIGLPIIYHPKNDDTQKEIYNNAFQRAKEVILSLAYADKRVEQEITTISVGKTPPKLYKTSTKIVEMPPVPEADLVKFTEFVGGLKLACERSVAQNVERASYEEHLNFAKKNEYSGNSEYDDATKPVEFYSTVGNINEAFSKNFAKDMQWKTTDRPSYEEHMIYAKRYSSAREYNSDKNRPKMYYASVYQINSIFSKKFSCDMGWVENKHSYSEHISFIKNKGYKSVFEYDSDNTKSSNYYSTVRSAMRVFKKDLPKHMGWTYGNTKKASYSEHITFIKKKKYMNCSDYASDKSKPERYYCNIKVLNKVYNKNAQKDLKWNIANTGGWGGKRKKKLTTKMIEFCIKKNMETTAALKHCKVSHPTLSEFCKENYGKNYSELLSK